MIHLFKKVYIETDHKLDVDENRIVISETTGYPVSSNFEETFAGKLYYCAENFESMLKNFGAEEIAEKNKPENQIDSGNVIILREEKEIFDNFYEFLNFVDRCYDEKKEPLYIHVDQKAFNFFMVYWYKILFPNITFDSLSALLKSYLLYNKAFGSSSKAKMRSIEFDLVFEMENLETLFNSLEIDFEKSKSFVENNKEFLSLEFLLSSYHYDKSCTQELINPVSSLIRKVTENELYETKERVYVHLNNKNFLSHMNLNDIYNFYNIENIITDENELDIIFDRKIWTKSNNILEGSSKETIDFSLITDEDIEKLCNIRASSEMTKEEYDNFGFSGYLKNTKIIFSCIKYFREKKLLTEEELNEILLNDMQNNRSFFYTLMIPINFYFLDHIFKSKLNNNTEPLKNFVLR
jgi:hypothetical protein